MIDPTNSGDRAIFRLPLRSRGTGPRNFPSSCRRIIRVPAGPSKEATIARCTQVVSPLCRNSPTKSCGML